VVSPLDGLARLREGRSRRVSSFDRSGGNDDRIRVEASATCDLAAFLGAGIVRHIWLTLDCADPLIRRNAILRMYWDGELDPSVQSPLGDFFGQGWGEHYPFSSLPLAAAPRDGRALVCYFPMPFARGARITLENQSDQPIHALYFSVDVEEVPEIPDDLGRFHAWWNRSLLAPVGDLEDEWGATGPAPLNPDDAANYVLLEAEGHGHYVGVNYFVDSPTPVWYGEGDDMFRVDGEPWPGSAHGTGTEDYFNMAWCPNEPFQHPYFGFGRLNGQAGWMGRTHCYRFHLDDPIVFRRSLRATVERGHANALTLDLASVAYWYQQEPHRPFPPLPAKGQRQPMPPIGVEDLHLWRQAWRQSRGGGLLWGTEGRPPA
jgi:hypothetical protein